MTEILQEYLKRQSLKIGSHWTNGRTVYGIVSKDSNYLIVKPIPNAVHITYHCSIDYFLKNFYLLK